MIGTWMSLNVSRPNRECNREPWDTDVASAPSIRAMGEPSFPAAARGQASMRRFIAYN